MLYNKTYNISLGHNTCYVHPITPSPQRKQQKHIHFFANMIDNNIKICQLIPFSFSISFVLLPKKSKNVVSTFGFAIVGPMFNPKRKIQILTFHCKYAVMTSIIFWKFDPDEPTIELSIVITCWFIGLRIPLMDDDNPQYIENYSYYSAPSKFCT